MIFLPSIGKYLLASTTLNLVDLFPLEDILSKSVSPVRTTKNLEDNLALVGVLTYGYTIRTLFLEDILGITDTLIESHTERFIRNLEDGLGIGEVFGFIEQNQFIINLEDIIILGEEFNESHNLRSVVSFEDIVALVDDILVTSTDRVDININDTFTLIDFFTIKGTDRFIRGIEDIIALLDVIIQEYGIRIESVAGGEGFVDGLSFVSLQVRTEATLSITLNPNWIFFKWNFLKSGITNIYDPNTTLTMPAGGGIITPIFINIGVIVLSFSSIIIVLDPNFLEYNADPDGDYISTTEKITMAGDAVTVARHNITIEQGSTFQNIVVYRDVDGNPVDLTGYTAEMQIRKTKESGTIISTLNTSNGRLVLGGTNGIITINIPASITDALDFVWGRYDLELYPGGDITQAIRLLEGKINLSKQVTQ